MPRAPRPWSLIEAGETDVLSIGFGSPVWSQSNQYRIRTVYVPQFGVGETIAAVDWGCAALIGDDPDANECLGAETYTGTIASVVCSGFLAGVVYVLEAAVTTSIGRVLKASSSIECIESPFPNMMPIVQSMDGGLYLLWGLSGGMTPGTDTGTVNPAYSAAYSSLTTILF